MLEKSRSWVRGTGREKEGPRECSPCRGSPCPSRATRGPRRLRWVPGGLCGEGGGEEGVSEGGPGSKEELGLRRS